MRTLPRPVAPWWPVALAFAVGCGGSVDAIAQTGPADGACAGPSCADAGADAPSLDAPGSSDASDATSEVPDAEVDAAEACKLAPATICNPVADCGCPSGYTCLEGEKCRLHGDIGAFEVCSNLDPNRCGAGLVCVGGASVCKPSCETAADCQGVDPYRRCYGVGLFGPYGTCTRECDPAAPTSTTPPFSPCGAGVYCTADLNGITDCNSIVSGPQVPLGGACSYVGQCPIDADCAVSPGADADAGNVCVRWCHADGTGAPCDAPSTCVPMGRSAGPIPLGYCVAP